MCLVEAKMHMCKSLHASDVNVYVCFRALCQLPEDIDA